MYEYKDQKKLFNCLFFPSIFSVFALFHYNFLYSFKDWFKGGVTTPGFQAGPYFPYFLITALIFLIWALKS